MDELARIWDEQADFNRLFRKDAETFDDRTALTKEFVLQIMSECDELLRHTTWKPHRKDDVRENLPSIKMELVDIFKNWLTLVQGWGFTPEQMVEAYWHKSMICRQRYAEEWLLRLDRDAVVIDIDNVLCDYVRGVGEWFKRNTLLTPDQLHRLNALIHDRGWLSAGALNMDPRHYQELKHKFRLSGLKATLPLMPGAREFLDWCRSQGWLIVLLTSRPIDEYPNLYTDTLLWLQVHHLPYDFVWWGNNKADRLLRPQNGEYRHIRFAVDDDVSYCGEYGNLGVRAYLLRPQPLNQNRYDLPWHFIRQVRSLEEIVKRETEANDGDISGLGAPAARGPQGGESATDD